MLPLHTDTIRLFLHVLAATVWVGGQLTLAGLVPTLRAAGGDTSRLVARRFNQIAWPAFAVLVVTGMWNIAAVDAGGNTEYQATLGVKLVFVVISGIAAFMHMQARTKAGLAVWGALSAVSSVLALFFGIWLTVG
jgi:putative copper export protein